MADPTATEALAAAGFTHRRSTDRGAPLGVHDIIDADGKVVATMKAYDVWEWLGSQRQGVVSEEPKPENNS